MRRGYGEADIGKLWGGNDLRVFKAVEAKGPAVSRPLADHLVAARTP